VGGTALLKGRVALVTGAASGLGRATSVALAEAGAHVVLADVNPAGNEETRAMVTGVGGAADVVHLDVTDDENRRSVVAGVFERHGDAFDVLVNVAGIDRPGYITDIDLADYRQVQAVNCEGPIFLTSEFLKRIQHLPEGRTADVVHIVSLSAITSGSGAISYNGSKAGFRNATACIQRELREKAVRLPDGTERPFPCRVQSVIPAAMDTPMMEQWGIPAHLMMPPSAVAEMVATLLSLHPSCFVPEMQIVPRLEPNFPR
jgi:NAD(P)-dependent dehydrogenase (short-subunit alcohol dehydrogenase family)